MFSYCSFLSQRRFDLVLISCTLICTTIEATEKSLMLIFNSKTSLYSISEKKWLRLTRCSPPSMFRACTSFFRNSRSFQSLSLYLTPAYRAISNSSFDPFQVLFGCFEFFLAMLQAFSHIYLHFSQRQTSNSRLVSPLLSIELIIPSLIIYLSGRASTLFIVFFSHPSRALSFSVDGLHQTLTRLTPPFKTLIIRTWCLSLGTHNTYATGMPFDFFPLFYDST